MAKHKIKIRNCAGGLYWIARPVTKMNNKELAILKRSKRFVKRYSSKKMRNYLKNETRKEEDC